MTHIDEEIIGGMLRYGYPDKVPEFGEKPEERVSPEEIKKLLGGVEERMKELEPRLVEELELFISQSNASDWAELDRLARLAELHSSLSDGIPKSMVDMPDEDMDRTRFIEKLEEMLGVADKEEVAVKLYREWRELEGKWLALSEVRESGTLLNRDQREIIQRLDDDVKEIIFKSLEDMINKLKTEIREMEETIDQSPDLIRRIELKEKKAEELLKILHDSLDKSVWDN